MKILLFHMRFHPDPTGTAPLVSQLVEDLVAAGEQVEVIASLPHYGRADVHPDYRDRQGLFHTSNYRGARIWRTPVYVPPRPTIFHRALNYLSYTLLSVIAGLKIGKTDIVLAINPPITTIFSAWVIALLRRAPLVVGIQDIWPDCVILVGQLRNKFLIRISKWMERIQYRIASEIIVLSQEMKNNLETKRVPAQKITLISNWADPQRVKPQPRDEKFLKRHQLDDRLIILFAGNHGFNAALEFVLAAAEEIKSIPNVEFLLVGEGNVKKELVDQARMMELKNVRFLPTQSEDEYPKMLASADIGLVTLRKTLGDLSLPSKVFTLMAAGKPILASVPENSSIKSLVESVGCGVWVPPEDPVKLSEAVRLFHNQEYDIESMGQKGRAYLEKNYSRRSQTAKYHQLLLEVTSQRRAK